MHMGRGRWTVGALALALGACATPAWQLSERSAIHARQQEARRRYPKGTPPCHDLKSCRDECDHDRWASCGRLAGYYRVGDGVLPDPEQADHLALTPCLATLWGTAEERAMCCAHAVAVRVEGRVPARTDAQGYERYRFLHRNDACAIACSSAFPVACTEQALQLLETEPRQPDDLKAAAATLHSGCAWGHAAACALLAELPPELLAGFQAEQARQAIRLARPAPAVPGTCAGDDDCPPGVLCAEATAVDQPRQCEPAVRCGSGSYCQGALVCEPHPGLIGADGYCARPAPASADAYVPAELRPSNPPRCFLALENKKVCY
jgi:hypothetical protein